MVFVGKTTITFDDILVGKSSMDLIFFVQQNLLLSIVFLYWQSLESI